MKTILIKNGLVYDGSGGVPLKTDIFIRNGHIAQLGSFKKETADIFLDATGAVVTPGLIDMNFEAEHYSGIFAEPYQENILKRGITTVIGSVEGLFGRPLGETLFFLEKRGVGVNFGALAGYEDIRRFFTKGIGRDLNQGEAESAKNAVSRTLREGALGISLDLSSPAGRGIPVNELIEIARESAKMKKVFAAHLRWEGEKILESIGEIINISKTAGANVEISHFQPLRGFSENYRSALALLEKEASKSHVNFDIFPHPTVSVPLYYFLPDWLRAADFEEVKNSLKEKTVKDRVLKHLQKIKIDGAIIAFAPPALKFLEGKSLDDFARNHGLTKARSILKLMALIGLEGKIFCFWGDKAVLEDFLASQRSFVTLSYHHFGGEAGAGEFFSWAEKSGKLPVEKAVAKLTGLPAAKYGILKRGMIKENYWADAVIWENWKSKTVLVNGVIAMENGMLLKKKAGAIVKAAP
ncbi:MAG: hypothetical protein AAB700_01235 [Patescibacteria group bacterium]